MFEKAWLAGYDEVRVVMELEDTFCIALGEVELPSLSLYGSFFWRKPGVASLAVWCDASRGSHLPITIKRTAIENLSWF